MLYECIQTETQSCRYGHNMACMGRLSKMEHLRKEKRGKKEEKLRKNRSGKTIKERRERETTGLQSKNRM